MTKAIHSRYIRQSNKCSLIRKWIVTTLLRTDLESHMVFGRLESHVLAGFNTSEISRENCDDVEFMRDWLERQSCRLNDARFDETDVFGKNTRQIQKALGLSPVELDILRFACLMRACKSLESAAETGGGDFSEVELCDLLSEALGWSFHEIFEALNPGGLLRESGLVRCTDGWCGSSRLGAWLVVPGLLVRQVFRSQENGELLEGVFYNMGPKPTLMAKDFKHVGSELRLLREYLDKTLRSRAKGANILLWGTPGTGKTEMARYLAHRLRKELLEVSMIDIYGDAIKADVRLDCYRLCQAVTVRSNRSLVLFDEVEDVLSDKSFADWGFKSDSKITKGLINTVLENNTTPSIWITNTVGGVDPAYLRRFDIVLQMKTPLPHTKRRIARKVFQDVPIDRELVNRIASNRSLTPAHLEKVSKICQRLEVDTAVKASAVVKQVLDGDLRALQARPLEAPRKVKKKPLRLRYRAESLNCDTDLSQLTSCLDKDSSVRMCLFGPPGTGKTAWAAHLARSVRRPLLVKHASDILDKFVGATEKNIAQMFDEAREHNSILMLDEADSFLPDRSMANRQWEITQANQFLTAMERYQGIMICTTNLVGNLDPATLRRFDFKVNFDYLEPEHVFVLAMDLLKLLGSTPTTEEEVALRSRLARHKLSHGDFAALLRRYAATNAKPSAAELVSDLKTEVGFREKDSSRPIGFLAAV